MIGAGRHWESIYRTRRADEVSWYRAHLDVSLAMIEAAVPDRDACIVDVGAGESTLVDDLVHRGYRDVWALDLSATALGVARERLGADAAGVRWRRGNVLTFPFPRHAFDVWHDRAVFHFLTDRADRATYVRQVAHAVKPDGHVVVATFGPEGPTQCSGLDVVRHAPDALHDEFGAGFRLVGHRVELHRTPGGATQQFTYCYCRLDGS